MMTTPVINSIKQLWRHAGLDESFVRPNLFLKGDPDSAVPSSFKVGHLAQTSVALCGLAASRFHGYRNDSEPPRVEVDARHALLNFASEAYILIDGEVPKDVWDVLSGLYATQDGHVRIHTNFPHHRDGILNLLQCSPTRAAVADALKMRASNAFEEEATAAGMCVAAVRTFTQWDGHPQSQALKGKFPFELIKIADAPARAKTKSTRPLEGIRMLELTRVVAGPIAGRVVADFGADVLWITSPNLPSLPELDLDTSRGKRATQLDLNNPENMERLRELVADADVFLQSYRPSSLSQRGFSPEALARLKPGIILANLRGYGWDGPWAEKRAFDSLVQAATGFNAAEGEAWVKHTGEHEDSNKNIKALPVQCLDHAAGQFLAFGVMAALSRSSTEGGSWEVRVSLAGVGQWLRELGQLSTEAAFKGQGLPRRSAPAETEIQHLAEEWKIRNADSKMGSTTLTALKSAISLEGLPSGSYEVPGSLNCDKPSWKESKGGRHH